MTTDEFHKLKRQIIAAGRLSPSSNLEGIITDFYYYLEQSGLLKVLKIVKTGDPQSMLEVRCKLVRATNPAELIVTLEQIWITWLAYSAFEAHAVYEDHGKVALDFVTAHDPRSSETYITGRIVVEG